MAGLFGQNRTGHPISERQQAINQYSGARVNLLLVVIFTAVNILLVALQGDIYFLFSASIPYLLTANGVYLCGMYPDEFYTGDLALSEYLDPSVFVILLIISIAIVAVYLLTYFLSNHQRVGWMIAALVLFGIDTVAMFLYYGIQVDILVDILFHGWVLVSLCAGIRAHYKLKQMPVESYAAINESGEYVPAENDLSAEFSSLPDSLALRPADTETKSRTLLEADIYGRKVIYRRVKRVNELVIDGSVYAEYTALIERAHMLTANLGGHAIAVGYDGIDSYISVDGQIVMQKVRIV